uniref:Uncharacterized protein n=1 Tax=Solanum tuberosum TaxID=4113 RepID=M1DEF9_SOLTU
MARIIIGQGSEDLDITTTRANARRIEGDNVAQKGPPQAPPQAPIDPLDKNVTNEEFSVPAIVRKTKVKTEMGIQRITDLLRHGYPDRLKSQTLRTTKFEMKI